MNIWKSLDGMVEAEMTSAEIPSALDAANARGIALYDVRTVSDLTARFRLRRRDYGTLAALSEKRGDTLRLRRRLGVYWIAKGLLSRPMLLSGLAVFIAAALFLPTRIFFVRVEGNVTVPSRLILQAAEESGIRFGASRRMVRSEKMKNALLSALPQLQWAGVNTAGCVATVSVRERTDPEAAEPDPSVSSIVAARDGFIVSLTATRGNPLCRVGQAVKAGQVLISGYTDCGIRIQATRAEGEVYAQTSRTFTAVTPSLWTFRGDVTAVRRNYSLIVGKKRIFLWKDSGILQGSCGRMDRQYDFTLPGGFRLPVALCVEEYTSFEEETLTIEPTDADAALSRFAGRAVLQQMTAGKILGKQESVTRSKDVYRLEGTYACEEMIGRVRRERIGDTNGKSG